MSNQRPTVEQIAKVLGEPVGFDISETASKLRRNLLLISVVVIILIVGGIQAGADISLFGIKLTGVTPKKLMIGLAVVLTYHLIHYLWYCYELYSEWTLRLTGTRLSFVTGAMFGLEGADYPNNPRQSTPYTWWLQESRSMLAYEDLLRQVEAGVRGLDTHVEELQKKDMTSAGTVSLSMQNLKNTLEQVRNSLEATESVITNTRIPASLHRFDNRFRLLLKSQNMRVLLVEIGMPIFIALAAAAYLVRFFCLN
ncbi:hypothetical protein [Pseudomonas coronafaciens]|uniref:hypothetical protein n=1 Tax=Pseudomonas coronafaciens TaxID=53409 RepID=UPI000EFF2E1C|nr:hypothetical protein [Pseudomonas coronafaciens]